MSIRISLIALTCLMFPAAAQAAAGRVIGDSIGVGVSWAAKSSGVTSTAKNSVAIYSGAIMEQLAQAKEGETVFLSLGTNDAVGGALDVKAKVAAIVAKADKLGVKLVWIGPPCVLKDWEKHSKALDGILAAELANTSATYVSTQTPEFCSPNLHAGEGVHFTMAGYTRMWQKAAAAAGFSTAAAVASAAPADGASGPVRKKTKRKKHKSQAKRRPDTKEKPDTSGAAPQ